MKLLEGNNHWFVTADQTTDYVIGLIDDFVNAGKQAQHAADRRADCAQTA